MAYELPVPDTVDRHVFYDWCRENLPSLHEPELLYTSISIPDVLNDKKASFAMARKITTFPRRSATTSRNKEAATHHLVVSRELNVGAGPDNVGPTIMTQYAVRVTVLDEKDAILYRLTWGGEIIEVDKPFEDGFFP